METSRYEKTREISYRLIRDAYIRSICEATYIYNAGGYYLTRSFDKHVKPRQRHTRSLFSREEYIIYIGNEAYASGIDHVSRKVYKPPSSFFQ